MNPEAPAEEDRAGVPPGRHFGYNDPRGALAPSYPSGGVRTEER